MRFFCIFTALMLSLGCSVDQDEASENLDQTNQEPIAQAPQVPVPPKLEPGSSAFSHAQLRSTVARVESQMRMLSVALESFFIDQNSYPPMNRYQEPVLQQYRFLEPKNHLDWTLEKAHLLQGNRRHHLTTPVAYIKKIEPDPFRGTEAGDAFGYGSDGVSYFILTSWGPDGVDGLGEGAELIETEYTGARINDTNTAAFRGAKYTLQQMMYHPSNGIRSAGDIIRIGP